jgi:hypothetical protein
MTIEPPDLEYLFTYHLKLNRFALVHPLAEGSLAHAFAAGGDVEGPRLTATILPFSGDLLVVRKDGVALPNVRPLFQTDDGALISSPFKGVMDFGEGGYDKFLQQELPPVVKCRGAVRLRSGDQRCEWTNRLMVLGIAEDGLAELVLDCAVFAVN